MNKELCDIVTSAALRVSTVLGVYLYVHANKAQVVYTTHYNLQGLFIRLNKQNVIGYLCMTLFLFYNLFIY